MTPVKDYIKLQGRFRHMTEEQINVLQEWANRKWERDSAMVSE
jgi:2-oxoisovalerate ferredoxin oxidoreductase beta subunit